MFHFSIVLNHSMFICRETTIYLNTIIFLRCVWMPVIVVLWWQVETGQR